MRRTGDVVIALARAGPAGSRRVITWAVGRAVAPNSVTAISLLFALCAAAWLSGGSQADYLRGLAALAGWAVARVCARRLHAAVPQRPRTAARTAEARLAAASTASGRTDWLVLPGLDWPGADRLRAAAPVPVTRPRTGERDFAWLYEVCTIAAECAVYGGLTAGGEAAGWTGTWPLAIVTVVVVSVAEVAGTCARAAAQARSPRPAPRAWTMVAVMLPPPVAVRVLTAVLVLVRYGPRIALLTVLVIEAIALVRAVISLAEIRPPVAGPAGTAGAAGTPGTPGRGTLTEARAGLKVLLACRDDGPLARLAGRIVQGNLGPLPPALMGLVAIVVLTVLGLGKLPGVVALAPAVVLLLAAPGASHPHDGRLDWLAPVLICLAQYVYLGALGLAEGVPPPAVFSVISMIAVWYAALAASPRVIAPPRTKVLSSRPERIRKIIRRRADGLGWEGRVWIAALTGVLGVAVFGYLGLAAYLAALMARKVTIGYLLPPDGQLAGEGGQP